jgi:hypothetical protein
VGHATVAPQVAVADAEAKPKNINVWKNGADDGYIPKPPILSPAGFARLSQACRYQRVSEDGCQCFLAYLEAKRAIPIPYK